MSSIPKTICGICEENASKYKCSTCAVAYCSLTCYKKHKETPCQSIISSTPKEEEIAPIIATQKSVETDKEFEGPLRKEQLHKLAISPKMREYLQHSQLRSAIRDIDSSDDSRTMLKIACENNPSFAMFIDEMLAEVGLAKE